MMFDRRQGKCRFYSHSPPTPPAPVEREERKGGGCEINLSELSGLETQYESVGKQRTSGVRRWGFANYEPQSFNQIVRVLVQFEKALQVVFSSMRVLSGFFSSLVPSSW